MSQPCKYREHFLQHGCSAQLISRSQNLQPKYNLYAFFTRVVMNFVCDFGVNSPQTLQNKFGKLTHSREMSNTPNEQITYMLLFFLIFK